MATDYDPTKTLAWEKLYRLAQQASEIHISSLLSSDAERCSRYSRSLEGIFIDFSKNRVTDEVMSALYNLADESPLREMRDAMFRGEAINNSENRPALHTALRGSEAFLKEQGLGEQAGQVAVQKSRVQVISTQVRSGEWRGVTGKAITDVVNLGIGGSDLGPRMVCEALKAYSGNGPALHFVSNVDGEVVRSQLATLDPETTLVIVCSKSFTTQETLCNAQVAAEWFIDKLGVEKPLGSDHFLAVTAMPEAAIKEGVKADNIISFESWVGGRFSVWSPVGLAVAIAVGYDCFEKFLGGAASIDEHFFNSPWEENVPVIMALLGIWYGNFLNAETQAIIPYCDRLRQLPLYIQQLDMESNGKSVDRNGKRVNYSTAPVIWGTAGTDCQHSFFQLFHQGTHLIPVDFIGLVNDSMSDPKQHRVLLANMLAQSAALMNGKDDPDDSPYKYYRGNNPSTTILIDELSPRNLGALIAIYEHKIAAQGWLWNINSFDQWGVELGKTLARSLLSEGSDGFDASTQMLGGKVGL